MEEGQGPVWLLDRRPPFPRGPARSQRPRESRRGWHWAKGHWEKVPEPRELPGGGRVSGWGWGWGWAGPHLPQLLAHQGAEPEVDEALAARGPGLEVHHEHVGEEAEEGEVGQDVQVEDDHGRAEEGADAGQAPLGLQPPVPGGRHGAGPRP